METFLFAKKFWKYISGVYLPSDCSFAEKTFSILINLFHVLVLGVSIYASFAKYYFEKDNDYVDAIFIMFIILQIFGNFFLSINFVVYCFRKDQLVELTEKFQKAVDKRYNQSTAMIYENAERKSGIVSKWPFVFFFVSYNIVFSALIMALTIISLIRGQVNVFDWPNLSQLRWVC